MRFLPLVLLLTACGASNTSPPTTVFVNRVAPVARVVAAPEPPAQPIEHYIGAVGGLAVDAMLTVTDTSIDGRWVYEARGSKKGLRLHGKSNGTTRTWDVVESTEDDVRTGTLVLESARGTLTGTWQKPGSTDTLRVELARAVRLREGDHFLRARRVMVTREYPAKSRVPVFLPVVDGPNADKLNPLLALDKILDAEKESELGDGTEGADFDVLFYDAKLFTMLAWIDHMGAYPSRQSNIASFTWAGERIGASAFRPAQRAALVRAVDKRLQADWTKAKEAWARGPSDETSCGPDFAAGFLGGRGPSFEASMLDSVYVDATGVGFQYDFDFPHVVLACTPETNLHFTWDEIRPYSDPSGALGAR